jgi:flagellar biosynthesis chaperone FliJ
MKATRIETDKSYFSIVDRINALITIEGDTRYAAFVTSLNNRIDQYNTAIAQRKGRAKKAPEA